MIRTLITALVLAAALPAAAQSPAPPQNTDGLSPAIQRQLQACWSLPPGYAGQSVTITLDLFGDGTLAEDPQIDLNDNKARTKQAPLIESAIRAVRRCAPFTAFEGRGLEPDQKFAIAVTFAG